MIRLRMDSKKGAASFYIVAFSTLILLIIATSFAAIIVSEMTRTSNDDLSQSAYDSALAGVEDAKLALNNYMNCVGNGSDYANNINNNTNEVTCQDIVYWIKHPDCDMVGHILGRIAKRTHQEDVVIKETEDASNMMQAYTCVKIDDVVENYVSSVPKTGVKLVKVGFADGKSANDVSYIEIKWHFLSSNKRIQWLNYDSGENTVVFNSLAKGTAIPPTLALQLIQTNDTFSMSDFDMSIGGKTNRGTIYMVPTNDKTGAAIVDNEKNYNGAYDKDNKKNKINANAFVKSNDKTSKNKPYAVYCNDKGSDYACSVTVELPRPIGDKRNDQTFMFAVSSPYGTPIDDFEIAYFCKEGEKCSTETTILDNGTTEEVSSNRMNLTGQVRVDSTGRANDMYRRVETRLEFGDSSFPYPLYALQLLGNKNDELLKKNLTVTCEFNFPNRGC